MKFRLRSLMVWITLIAVVTPAFQSGPVAACLVATIALAVLFNYHITLSSAGRKIVSCSMVVLMTACASSLGFAFATYFEQPNNWSFGTIIFGFIIGFLLGLLTTLPFYAFAPEPLNYYGDKTKNREDLFPISSWFGGGG